MVHKANGSSDFDYNIFNRELKSSEFHKELKTEAQGKTDELGTAALKLLRRMALASKGKKTTPELLKNIKEYRRILKEKADSIVVDKSVTVKLPGLRKKQIPSRVTQLAARHLGISKQKAEQKALLEQTLAGLTRWDEKAQAQYDKDMVKSKVPDSQQEKLKEATTRFLGHCVRKCVETPGTAAEKMDYVLRAMTKLSGRKDFPEALKRQYRVIYNEAGDEKDKYAGEKAVLKALFVDGICPRFHNPSEYGLVQAKGEAINRTKAAAFLEHMATMDALPAQGSSLAGRRENMSQIVQNLVA